MSYILEDGPQSSPSHLIIAHGAGAGITSSFLETMASLVAARGIHIIRFEFDYMASRRDGGKKRPPPRAEKLVPEYAAMIASVRDSLKSGDRLFIGGKSLGGRVASLTAEGEYRAGRISGLVCLGYPFHPPGKPERTRTAHLADLSCPALIIQGTRDPLGSETEVATYALSPACEVFWIGDGDHDLKPRAASGFTRDGNLTAAADATAAFVSARRKRR